MRFNIGTSDNPYAGITVVSCDRREGKSGFIKWWCVKDPTPEYVARTGTKGGQEEYNGSDPFDEGNLERVLHRVVATLNAWAKETINYQIEVPYHLLEDYRGLHRVLSDGRYCPKCNSVSIEGGPVETGEGVATQEMGCTNCGAGWQDVYVLAGFSNLVEDEGEE